MLNEIIWPEEYLPGTTDNFACNEVIVKGLKAIRQGFRIKIVLSFVLLNASSL